MQSKLLDYLDKVLIEKERDLHILKERYNKSDAHECNGYQKAILDFMKVVKEIKE